MHVLLLIVLFVFSTTLASAQTFSCQDSQGELHYSDSWQGLPEECRDQKQVLMPTEPDNLNYVPTPKGESSEIEFKHSVRAAKREQDQRRTLAQDLRYRAERLREQYKQGIAEKWDVKTGWVNNKRKHVKVVNDKLLKIIERKHQLLVELETARVPSRDKEEIREVLSEIDDDINAG